MGMEADYRKEMNQEKDKAGVQGLYPALTARIQDLIAQQLTERVFCDVANTRRLGVVVKANTNTVWVKIMKGAKTSFTIKRHIIKHNVVIK